MKPDVKSRPYRSTKRAEGMESTRTAILEAARAEFMQQGYAASTVSRIAARAGVNVDTLYAVIGRKPDLMRAVVESAISGQGRPVPAEERDYVLAIQAARTARHKIEIYAQALAAMAPRTAPVFDALRSASMTDSACAALLREITERRADNMRRFAADLRATGSLRDDLTDDEVADIVWAMNSTDYYTLLVGRRGWTPEKYGRHLADAWCRLLLRPRRR